MKFSMTIFLVVLLLIGLTLTVVSFVLASSVDECSKDAQNALRGLLTMGVALFSITGTMLACKCTQKFEEAGSVLSTVFSVVLLVIGSVTIGLVATIHKECENARKITPFLLSLSVLITLGAIAYLGMKIYDKVKKPEEHLGLIKSTDNSASPRSDASNSPLSLYGG